MKKLYTFLFVDCMYVTVRKEHEAKPCVVYAILGYDINGIKEVLGPWISETESEYV